MGIIYKPYTFNNGDELSNKFANNDFDTAYDELNGALDDSNFKAGAAIDGAKFRNLSVPGTKILYRQIADAAMDYTSAHVLRMGPTISTDGIRVACGKKAWAIPNGSQIDTVFIIYSTDAERGDPRFSTGNEIVITLNIDHQQAGIGFAKRMFARVAASYATGCLVSIKADSAFAAGDASGFVHWRAIGKV